jgi:hypothetical protein
VKAIVGRINSRPSAPYVQLEDVQDWLTPSQARALAARLNQKSDEAIEKFSVHRAKVLARGKK